MPETWEALTGCLIAIGLFLVSLLLAGGVLLITIRFVQWLWSVI